MSSDTYYGSFADVSVDITFDRVVLCYVLLQELLFYYMLLNITIKCSIVLQALENMRKNKTKIIVVKTKGAEKALKESGNIKFKKDLKATIRVS